MFKKSISSLGSAFQFIFSEFGKLWALMLKSILAFVLLLLLLLLLGGGTMGVKKSLKMTQTPQDEIVQITSEIHADRQVATKSTLTISSHAAPQSIKKTAPWIKKIIGAALIIIVLIGILGVIFITSILSVNIIQSVVGSQDLSASFFNRFKDKDVYNYIKGYVLIYTPVVLVTIATGLLTKLCAPFSSLFWVLLLLLIPYLLRTLFIPIAYATGEATTFRSAWISTKGNSLSALMTFIVCTLTLAIIYGLYSGMQSLDLPTLASVSLAIVMLVLWPINFLWHVALVSLYKGRKRA